MLTYHSKFYTFQKTSYLLDVRLQVYIKVYHLKRFRKERFTLYLTVGRQQTGNNGCARMTCERANPSHESSTMHTEMGGLFRCPPMIRIVSCFLATRQPGACAVFNPSTRRQDGWEQINKGTVRHFMDK